MDPKTNIPILQLSPDAHCQAHLRLVIQPFNFSEQPLATAMHLIYNVSPEEERSVIEGLSEIKMLSATVAPTTGLPLMIHPALALEAESAGT